MDRPLKQRLWGAAVLIALAVIFLPMLLKGPAPDSGVADVPITAPPKPDAAGITTHELPLDVPGGAPGSSATGMPMPQPGNVAPAPAAATTATPSGQAAGGDFVVAFGTYGSAADAARVVQALQGIKLQAYAEPATVEGRPASRVRIGPFSSREAAEIARVSAGKLNSAVKSQVIALDAGNTAAADLGATPSLTPAATAAAASVAAATSAPAAPTATPKPAVPTSTPAATPKPAAVVAAKPAETKPVETKPVETKPVESKPAAAPAAAKPEPAKPHPAAPAVVAKHVDAPKPAAKPAEVTAAVKDATKPEPQPAAKPAAANTGFAVQLGAFANASEATALRDRARAAGFPATTDTVQTEKGVLTRVRLGPVASREAAESLRSRAQSKLGTSGIVRSTP